MEVTVLVPHDCARPWLAAILQEYLPVKSLKLKTFLTDSLMKMQCICLAWSVLASSISFPLKLSTEPGAKRSSKEVRNIIVHEGFFSFS